MIYEPKILINRTGHTVEFKCGGTTYIHEAGKKKPYEGQVAYHALNIVNTGLEEFIPKDEPAPKKKTKTPLSREELMAKSWKELLKMVGKAKKFTPGMNKENVVDILMNE